MTTHRLKTWPTQFRAVRSGAKPFEIRWNDREFAAGDFLMLEEFDELQGRHTGEVEGREVSYVLADERFGLKRGYVVLGLRLPAQAGELTADAPTPERLAAHHEHLAAMARLKEANWRESAADQLQAGAVIAAGRHSAAGDAAAAEAVHHEQAARIIRELMAKATPDLFGEGDRG